jgi:ribonuclease P protein component
MLKADQKLRKEERLKSRKAISELFENGQIIHHHLFKVLFKVTAAEKLKFPAQIAISVPKKNFKLAVTRNYIKRKIRESYRRNKHLLYTDLENFDQNINFFVIYIAKKDTDYASINESMILLLQKMSDKLKHLAS